MDCVQAKLMMMVVVVVVLLLRPLCARGLADCCGSSSLLQISRLELAVVAAEHDNTALNAKVRELQTLTQQNSSAYEGQIQRLTHETRGALATTRASLDTSRLEMADVRRSNQALQVEKEALKVRCVALRCVALRCVALRCVACCCCCTGCNRVCVCATRPTNQPANTHTVSASGD